MAIKEEFRFQYSKYQTSKVSIEQVNEIRKVASEPATNIITQIFLMVRILVLVGCAWLRKGIMDEEMLVQKQEYEIRRGQQGSGSLEEDDLDQLRGPSQIGQGVPEVDS